MSFDDKKDEDIVDLINNIRPRQINSFLKSLLRRSLDLNGLRCYFGDDYTPDSELGKQKAADREKRRSKRYKDAEFTLIESINKDKPEVDQEPEEPKPKPEIKKQDKPKMGKTATPPVSEENTTEVESEAETEEQNSNSNGFNLFQAMRNISNY